MVNPINTFKNKIGDLWRMMMVYTEKSRVRINHLQLCKIIAEKV